MNRKDIGDRIKKLRIDKLNISQDNFAKKIGISRSYLCKLEAGSKNFTFDTLIKICKGLDVTLRDFFDFETSKYNE